MRWTGFGNISLHMDNNKTYITFIANLIIQVNSHTQPIFDKLGTEFFVKINSF